MKRPALPLALLAALAVGGLLWIIPGEPFRLGGIQVNEPDHEVWVETLEEHGMNAVEVTVYAHQGAWDSDNLWFAATDEAVIHEARTARAAGLDVVLVLRVALDHSFPENRFLWHGMIHPVDDDALGRWFRRYRSFVAQWAEIAEREGIDVLAVGSEMNELASTVPVDALPPLHDYFLDAEKQQREGRRLAEEAAELAASGEAAWDDGRAAAAGERRSAEAAAKRAWAERVTFAAPGRSRAERVERVNRRRARLHREWERLVAEARRRYSGELTFAANFDQYREVSFWNRLDLLGLNAYFELRESWRPVDDAAELWPDLLAGWRRVLGEIDDFRRRLGRPGMRALFTELGYTRRRDSTLRPWAGEGMTVVPVAGTGGGDGKPEERLLVFSERPEDPRERALAVRALRRASREMEPPLLAGILWWKLSTRPQHAEIEPFVLVLDEAVEDPLVEELRAFR